MITAKALLILLINVSRYMDILIGLKAEEEGDINPHRVGEPTLLGLRMINKKHLLRNKVKIDQV